ncbi:MAG: glycosyltransferase family 39 protein [Anaerolineae bacterium]|nr:glycosyltransferase family 39 protein [Anaerolineae bacterium]
MQAKRIHVAAFALLLVLFALLVLGSRPISLTSDEPAHLVAGYSILTRGTKAFWILPQHGHPPLLNVLGALVFYIGKPDIPLETLNGWPLWFSDYVFAFIPYLAPVEQTAFAIRIPTVLFTVILGALIFRWGKEWWGNTAGLLALLVLLFDPLLLAHGRLATTDVGTVTLGTAALYLLWRWAEKPSWRLTWFLGLLCGLTMLSKGSGMFWLLTAGLAVVAMAAYKRSRTLSPLLLLQGLCVGLLSFLIVWAGHSFTWGTVGEHFPLPLPAPAYWIGILSQARSVEKRWFFALGLRGHGGWWWYFPVAFLIKNPLPVLIGLLVGLWTVLRRPFSCPRLLALGLFPLLYTIAAIRSGMNIGYRHMLPIHPAIYLIVAAGIQYGILNPPRRWWQYACALALGLWYVVGTLRMFGYEIAYFNELIGGPRNGHRYLIDSNIDWGQGYKALRDYLKAHPGPIPQLSTAFLNIDPEQYGISYQSLAPGRDGAALAAPFHPLPGRYVIGATVLQRGWPEDPDMYAWFRQVEPTAEIGYSFFLYDIATSPLQWIAQCSIPAAPLSDSLIERGFGSRSLRRIYFDCTAGWIYPSGGAQPGAYSLHYDLLKERKRTLPSMLLSTPEPRDPFIVQQLSGARLSVDVSRYTPEYPAFVLYEQEGAPPAPALRSGVTSPADAVPTPGASSIPTPIVLAGPLTFLGANVTWQGSELNVETWWQVTQAPGQRPLSIMGHLLTAQGEVLGIADGLGVPREMLEPGDILVQRHRFGPVTEGTALWLRTGAYWLDSLERWSVTGVPHADAIFVALETAP